MLLLLSCLFIAGFKAEDLSTMHYRAKGSSSCFEVRKSPPFVDVRWSNNPINKRFIVLYGKITPSYKGRFDYNPNNHSLCIHKLTEADSGIYEVSLIHLDYNGSTETNKLVVQAPVPKPVIRMSVDLPGSNLSAGFCNILVNCSVLGDWLFAVCDADSCRTSQRSFSKANITISAHNRSVVCSGHNHVSVRNASENMEETCNHKSDKKHDETSELTYVIPIVVPVVAVLVVVACIVCLVMGFCSTKCNRHQTSTARLIQSQPIEPQPQPGTRNLTSSSSQPEASYENVDVTQPSEINSPIQGPHEALGPRQSQTVDTVYSVLQLPRVNDSPGKSDRDTNTKDHEVIEVASTPEPGVAEHDNQVDTVYSVLQKPKR
ncbi:uncharacterized protein LOC117807137 isoform X2 [Notolabrus celidotus]|uniref:uncharacterized protein LOC117807137 isoform X2 n=1 Tax=Notolabrus celidotus TaxID=1203425 RepID=UPI00148F5159|nr:uncharacterized protein LOC117807137 isoform X2 [Notolabrus celidotus]